MLISPYFVHIHVRGQVFTKKNHTDMIPLPGPVGVVVSKQDVAQLE